MIDYIFIDRNDYDVSYTEMVEWSLQSGFAIWAVNSIGINGSANLYAVETTEALTAFKIRFPTKPKPQEDSVDIDFFETGDQ